MFVLRRVFIVFSPDVLLCELSGIPFRLDSRNHSHDFRVDEETRHKNSCPNIGVLLKQNEHWHDGRLLDGVFDDEA